MKERKSFLLYSDLIHTLSYLSNEQAGVFIKNVLAFVNNVDFEITDIAVKIAFEPVKQHLLRNADSYAEKINYSLAGSLKRWYPNIYKSYKNKEITFDEALERANLKKVSPQIDPNRPQSPLLDPNRPQLPPKDPDSLNVNDNVNNNVNDKKVVGKDNRPTILEIEKYFQKKIENPKKEAEKFFAHNNATGWKIKGQPVKNWKSLADLWIISEETYKKEKKLAPKKEKEFDYEAEKLKDPRYMAFNESQK